MDRRSACVALALGVVGCGSSSAAPSHGDGAPCSEPATKGSPFGTQCGYLVDSEGRVVLLRGVNARVDGVFDVSFDDGRLPLEPIPKFDAGDAAEMRDFGFDALRLPIDWSGLEPTETGGFDEAYLDRVAQAVDAAASAGLVVLLDMHQDAYSKEIGEDGAPLWAIVPPPTQLLGGPLTDLGDRRLSAQVLAAFDTFFGDSAEGAALRTRLVAAATHVMERFADDPAVMGFEIFNEPQATSDGIERLNAIAYPALREAAPTKLYLFEPSATRNLTDIAPIPDAPLGPMAGYAPHVYTLAFVGDDAAHQSMTKETLRRSNANARTEADTWQAPLVITEWGYDPNGIQASAYFTWQSELQEEYGASSFFWVWKEESQGSWGCFDHDTATDSWTPRAAVRDALARVRPARIAGWPESVRFDRQSGELELDFRGNPRVKADHEIAIAPALGTPQSVSCDGAPADYSSSDPGSIRVPCARGESGEHVLRVSVPPQAP